MVVDVDEFKRYWVEYDPCRYRAMNVNEDCDLPNWATDGPPGFMFVAECVRALQRV